MYLYVLLYNQDLYSLSGQSFYRENSGILETVRLGLNMIASFWNPWDCFTNVSRAPQNILAKIHNTRNHIYGENFNMKICTCAQSKALGTRTKFQLEILITSTICAIHKFRENFLESSRNVSETTPSTMTETAVNFPNNQSDSFEPMSCGFETPWDFGGKMFYCLVNKDSQAVLANERKCLQHVQYFRSLV